MQRVFVQVVGFNDVERHALNTTFRLSQDSSNLREWSFEPWTTDAPNQPKLSLIDGAHPEANAALQEAEAQGIGIIWVGSISPAKAFSSHQRPLKWPELLSAMDGYFTPTDGLDFSLSAKAWPSVLESTGAHMLQAPGSPRALVADADSSTRFYWRSKLATVGITDVVEAATVEEVREALGSAANSHNSFLAVVIDMDLPGGDAWRLLSTAGTRRLKLATISKFSFSQRMAAKINGFVSLSKPLDPQRINDLLPLLQ